MPITLAAALLAAPAAAANCSWDRPGHNPFMGDVVAAVDRYTDIPAATRAKLKARMAARQYDEIVTIQRDAIVGRARYGSEISDMHFGTGQVCGTVTRAKWSKDLQERGLVYCEDGQCILVPTVCRNVSRVQRHGPAVAAGPGLPGAAAGAGAGDDPGAAMAQALDMAPPGAGLGQMPAAGNAPDSFAQGASMGAPGAEGGPTTSSLGLPGGEGLGGPADGAVVLEPGQTAGLDAPMGGPGGSVIGGAGPEDVLLATAPPSAGVINGGSAGNPGGGTAPSFPGGFDGGGGGLPIAPPLTPPLSVGPSIDLLPAVPEPSTLWMLLGGAGLVLARVAQQRRAAASRRGR